jgi:hypothetical protein
LPVSAEELFDRMAFGFMARFNWTPNTIDSLPFTTAMGIRNFMAEEDRKTKSEQRKLETQSRRRR